MIEVCTIGGYNEVGKNMTAVRVDDEVVIIDMGLHLDNYIKCTEDEEEDMVEVSAAQLVKVGAIPNDKVIENWKDKVKAIVPTHAHLDHVGALIFLSNKYKAPILCTPFTAEVIKTISKDENIKLKNVIKVLNVNSVYWISDKIKIEFINMTHSTPQTVMVAVHTPDGILLYANDFKFDNHPADDKPAEINKMKFLGSRQGSEKVIALFSDSTNALKPGRTVSERVIGESLDNVIASTNGRIIIASFASLIGRIQQVLNSAQRHGRIVAISGRSMEVNIRIARELGYLKIPKGVVKSLKEVLKMPDDRVLILTTGSQGEAMSALTRMSLKDHKQVQIKKGDTVIISAHPIIGNEQAVATVINNLCKLGANIVNNDIMDVHTSGHGNQDDLEQMMRFINPLNLVPIHGNLYMRTAHAKIARRIGFKEENVFLFDSNGDVLEIENGRIRQTEERVPSNYIVVDGLGTGDIGSQVLLDREIMAQNGIVVVVFRMNKKSKELLEKPFITTRGFVYMKESEKVVAKLKEEAEKSYKQILHKDPKAKQWDVCNYVKRVLDGVSHRMLARRPLIVVLAMRN